jgi:hypothetical protein
MNLGLGRAGKWAATLAGLLAVASVAGGCAIHTQGPIKEVAYDFSDRDFYDRSYAPAPTYQHEHEGHGAPLRAPAQPVTAAMFQGEPAPALPAASVVTSVIIDPAAAMTSLGRLQANPALRAVESD